MKNLISFHINIVNDKKRFSCGLPFYMTACLILFCLLFAFTGCAANKPLAPEDTYGESPASQLIHFYQGPLDHLSSVRHGGCPMHPGCSNYGLAAIEKHGLLIGWVMTFDRLMRCGLDETHLSPEVLVNGKWKYLDTLEQNDFWWCDKQSNKTLQNARPLDGSLNWGISVE